MGRHPTGSGSVPECSACSRAAAGAGRSGRGGQQKRPIYIALRESAIADNAKRAAYMHLKDEVDEASAESSRWGGCRDVRKGAQEHGK